MSKNLKTAIITALVIAAAILAFRAIFNRPTGNKLGMPGLDRTDVAAANVRWAIFEEWVKAHPQYKNWESDPEVFKKANAEFKEKANSNVTVIK